MGEIAESMINGECDFYTGEYIGRGGGFPRTHNPRKKFNKRDSLKGISSWFGRRKVSKRVQIELIRKFVTNHKLTTKEIAQESKANLCALIQIKGFQTFSIWAGEELKSNQK